MRILFIRSTAFYYGSETPAGIRISNFMRTWRDCGDEVTLCHYVSVDADMAKLKDKGICYELLPISKQRLVCIRRIEKFISLMFPKTLLCAVLNYIMLRYAKTKFKAGDFDCVITSVPEFGSLIAAHKIASYLKIPFVADFRDLPDEFDPEHKQTATRKLVRTVSKLLSKAALVNVVSPLFVDAMVLRYGCPRDKVFVVMNGYDGDFPVKSMFCGKPQSSFVIFYAGAIYIGRDKTFKLIFAALDLLSSQGVDVSCVRVRVAGPGIPAGFPGEYKSAKLFEYIGKLPRNEVLKEESKSSVLLNLSSPEVPGIMPSKVFEYAKMRRPILTIPSKTDVVAEFVQKTSVGTCCETVEEIADYLKERIRQWTITKFIEDPAVNFDAMKAYSRTSQAKLFRSELRRGLNK